jgi:putative ABC transport system permease protein
MLKLALRNLSRHKLRTGLTLAAVVFGVTGLILSGGFVRDIFYQLGEGAIHAQLGHIQVSVKGYHDYALRDPQRYMIDDPGRLEARIRKLPEVVDVMQRVGFFGLLNNGRTDLPIIGEGVEADKEARLGTSITMLEGRQLSDTDKYGILLGEGVARSLGLHIGDYANLVVNTPGGALNTLDFKVVGVMRTMSRDYDARSVRIGLTASHELLLDDKAHTLVLSLTATSATDRVAAALQNILPASSFEIKPWYELADFYRKTVALYQRQFGLLVFIVLIMVLLGVANSVNMTIFERVGECGTIMALGYRSREVFKMLVIENVLLGLLGGSLGVSLGLFLGWLISLVGISMPAPPNMSSGYLAEIRPDTSIVVLAFVVGAVATILASILPARRAVRIPVVDALRRNG